MTAAVQRAAHRQRRADLLQLLLRGPASDPSRLAACGGARASPGLTRLRAQVVATALAVPLCHHAAAGGAAGDVGQAAWSLLGPLSALFLLPHPPRAAGALLAARSAALFVLAATQGRGAAATAGRTAGGGAGFQRAGNYCGAAALLFAAAAWVAYEGAPPPPPPPSRTNWTRLVPPPVLTGHVSSLLQCPPRPPAGSRCVRGRAQARARSAQLAEEEEALARQAVRTREMVFSIVPKDKEQVALPTP